MLKRQVGCDQKSVDDSNFHDSERGRQQKSSTKVGGAKRQFGNPPG